MQKSRAASRMLAAAVAAAIAYPAGAADPAAASGESLEEIVVTGTHLQAAQDSPTPVTVVDAATVQNRAPADVLEVLNQIPQFRATTQTQGSDRLSLSQSGVQGLVDLRGLGATRTLTLVDGQRFVGGNLAGLVDTNLLPVSLLDQVEVVTGGASAAYGSDAVAGVVNFKLKDHMDGITGSIQRGMSEYFDEKEWVATVGAGTNFADNRAHVVLGLDYADNDGAGSFYSRSYGRLEPGLVSAGNGRPAGTPAQFWSNGVELSNATPGGLILSGPLKGVAFDGSGNPYNFNYGTVYSSAMIGSQANYGFNPQGYAIIGNPFSHKSAYSKLTVDASDRTSLWVSGNFAVSSSYSIGAPPTSVGPITIGVDNPYLPSSIHDAMLADGLSTISVGKIFANVGGNSQEITNHLWRLAAGAKGEILNGWKWDVYAAVGLDTEHYNFNGIQTYNIYAASNAVLGANGAVTCGNLATNPNLNPITITYVQPNCVPFDIFGNSSPATDPAAYDYMFNPIVSVEKIHQTSGGANLNGSPFSDWAGPVQIGVGAEYRSDSLNVVSDEQGAEGHYFTSGQGIYGGHNDVKEGYLEAGIPLLKDLPFARSLDLNLAGRETDYDIEGSVRTWKVGFTDDITDSLRLRATKSHDIRVPNLFELFGVGPPAIQLGIVNRFNGQSGNVRDVQAGNLNLRPEVANTITAGLVFDKSIGNTTFRSSVDYFDIRMHDVIAAGIGVQATIDGCYAGNQSYCNNITFDNSALGIALVSLQSINLNALYTNGVDFEVEMRQNELPFGMPGSLDWHLLASFTNHMSLTTPAGRFEYAGSTATIGSGGTFPNGGGMPTWRGNLTTTYTIDKVSAALQLTGFNRLTYNPTLVGPDSANYNPAAANSISQNQFRGEIYANLMGGYQTSDHLKFFGVINNLLDRKPPNYAINAFSTNAADLYDTVGRSYKLGVRFNY